MKNQLNLKKDILDPTCDHSRIRFGYPFELRYQDQPCLICGAIPEKFLKSLKKTVFVINTNTRTIRRIQKQDLQAFLFGNKLVGNDIANIKFFNKWPTEKQYFEITGEW
jgi:hypothetical protein